MVFALAFVVILLLRGCLKSRVSLEAPWEDSFAGSDGLLDGVFNRSDDAIPARVVGTIRVVGEVKVEGEFARRIRALSEVEVASVLIAELPVGAI